MAPGGQPSANPLALPPSFLCFFCLLTSQHRSSKSHTGNEKHVKARLRRSYVHRCIIHSIHHTLVSAAQITLDNISPTNLNITHHSNCSAEKPGPFCRTRIHLLTKSMIWSDCVAQEYISITRMNKIKHRHSAVVSFKEHKPR